MHWRAVLDRTATARVQRLIRWLELFQRCFGHRAQRLALRTYVHGVFSDSDRKSMQAMLARVTDSITYQGFQHFITHAVWEPRNSTPTWLWPASVCIGYSPDE
jgi:SRSO17 transposase